MFKPAVLTGADPARYVEIQVDDRPVMAREGEMLAIALMEGGVSVFRRTPVSGQGRAPLCLMGVCFDCLVHVDGRRNVQSCMVQVEAGMRVALPQGARTVGETA
jgi:predicted molibdopterin-dependent oxidoreductase YjgC